MERIISKLKLANVLQSVSDKRATQLDLLNADRLRALCSQYGLSSQGKKDVLKERIRVHCGAKGIPISQSR